MALKKACWFRGVSFLLIFSLALNQTAFGAVQASPAGASSVKSPAGLNEFATVSDIFVPNKETLEFSKLLSNSSQKLLIFIEDAHGNISAQKNIANILDWASKESRLKSPWIALEGTAVGEIDHRVLSAFPYEPTRRITTDYFLSTGEIDGAVYYASLFNAQTKLFGVDDKALADKNRDSYRQYLISKDETQKAIKDFRAAADFLKDKIYFGDLIRLDKSSLRFERNGNQLLKHLVLLEELAKKYKVDLNQFPHISALIELKTLESKPQASKERVLELSKKLEGIQVFKEIGELNETLWTSLLSYPEAKDARTLDKIVKFYEKLFDFSLAPDDYAQYLKNAADYSPEVLQEKIINYNFILRPKTLRPTDTDYASIKKALPTALNFYEFAEKRNEVLTNNLLELAARNPQKKTFFIAGGFHRNEISKILRQKGIPYAVLSPKITDSLGTDNYWREMGGRNINALDYDLAARFTMKLAQKFSDLYFRVKVGLLNVATVKLTSSLPPREIDSLIQKYLKKIDQRAGQVLASLIQDLKQVKDALLLALGINNYRFKIVNADSLGTQANQDRFDVANVPVSPEKSLSITGQSLGTTKNYVLTSPKGNKYETIQILSEKGAMGVTWLAHDITPPVDTNHPIRVVIKTPRRSIMEDKELYARFCQEATMMQTLRDESSIPRYIDSFLPPFSEPMTATPWFAMEYIQGEELDKLLKRNVLDLRQKISLIQQLLQGLMRLQKLGVVHRDIKPGNIMVQITTSKEITRNGHEEDIVSYQLKLIDLGLSKFLENSNMTSDGKMMGTPQYMSPEQVNGIVAEIGPHTDVYAVGAMFYEMITNQPPYKGRTAQEIVMSIINEKLEPDWKLIEDKKLRAILKKALAKNINDRYQNAAQFFKDLQNYEAGKAPVFAEYKENVSPASTPHDDLTLQEVQAPAKVTGRRLPVKNTGRQEPVKTPRGANGQVAPPPGRHHEKPAPAKSNMATWLAVGGAVVLTTVIGLVLSRGGTPVEKPGNNGKGPDIPKVEPNPKDDPIEIARKEAEAKRQAAQREIDTKLVKLISQLSEIEADKKSTESMKNRMYDMLKKMREKIDEGRNNLGGGNLEGAKQAAQSAQTDGKEIAKLGESANAAIGPLNEKIKSAIGNLTAVAADANASQDQKDRAGKALENLGKVTSEVKTYGNDVAKALTEGSDSAKTAIELGKAAADPTLAALNGAKMEIENLRKLTADLQNNAAYKKLGDAPKVYAEVLKKIQTKTDEILATIKVVTSETSRLAAKSPTEQETAKFNEIKTQLTNQINELKVLTDQVPELQKQYDLAALQQLLDQINKSLTSLDKTKQDPNLQKLLADAKIDVTTAYNAAKAAVAEMANNKEAFEKAQSAVVNEAAIADMKIKAESYRLEFNAIESAWKKAQSSKELDNRVTAAQTAWQKAMAAAQRGPDNKLPLPQRTEQAKELRASADKAEADYKKTKKDVEDAKRDIQKAINDLNAVLTKIFTLVIGELGKTPTPVVTADQQQRFADYSTQSAELYTSLHKSFDINKIPLNIEVGVPTVWKYQVNGNLTNVTYLKEVAKQLQIIQGPVYVNMNGVLQNAIPQASNYFLTNVSNEFSRNTNFEWSTEIVIPKTAQGKILLGLYSQDAETVTYLNLHSTNKNIVMNANVAFNMLTGKSAIEEGDPDRGKVIAPLPSAETFTVIWRQKKESSDLDIYIKQNGQKEELISTVPAMSGKKHRAFFYSVNLKTRPEDCTGFGNITIKGNSLGQNPKTVWDQYQSAQSELSSGILILPYNKQLIEKLIHPEEHLFITNTRLIFITSSDKYHDEAKRIFGSLERLKKYNIQIQKPDHSVNLIGDKKGDIFILTHDALDIVLNAAATFFATKKDNLGRPVIFETSDFMSDTILVSDNLADATVVPMESSLSNLVGNLGYRTAYFISAAAISKGDNTNYGFKIFGKLILINELISAFQQNARSLLASARSA